MSQQLGDAGISGLSLGRTCIPPCRRKHRRTNRVRGRWHFRLRGISRPAMIVSRICCALALTVLAIVPGEVARADIRNELLELIDEYRRGNFDTAVERLTGWEWHRVRESRRGRKESTWPVKTLEAAVLLHIETAMRHTRRPWLQTEHTVIARELLAARRSRGSINSAVCDLHVALARHLQADLRFEDLETDLKAARRICPGHAQVLLASGTLEEAFASRRSEAARRVHLAPSREASLADAERFYRQALEAAPDLVEARVRLGRVLHDSDRPRAAVVELTRAAHDAHERSETDLTYLALIFQASAYEVQDDPSAALPIYRRARDLLPGCQAAVFGISRTLGRLRFVDEAARVVRDSLLNGSTPRCADPWRSYDFGQSRTREPLIRELRERLRR